MEPREKTVSVSFSQTSIIPSRIKQKKCELILTLVLSENRKVTNLVSTGASEPLS